MSQHVDPYVAALSSRDIWIRLLAISALGNAGADASVVVLSLARLLADEAPCVRQSAAAALGRLGRTSDLAVPALSAALSDASVCVRVTAGASLAGIGSAAAAEPLCILLGDNACEARRCAAWALGKLGTKAGGATTPLVGTLNDHEAQVRGMAAWALGKLRGLAGEAVPPLIAMLKEEQDREVRQVVAVALGRIGRDTYRLLPGIRQALTTALLDPELGVHRAAVHALRELHPPAEAHNSLRTTMPRVSEHVPATTHDLAHVLEK